MPTAEEEAAWRAEFEAEGETAIRDAKNLFQEPKRQFAFLWLREQTAARKLRDERTYRYVRWTFVAAIAAVIVGISSKLARTLGEGSCSTGVQ
jgi:hypothetical protein